MSVKPIEQEYVKTINFKKKELSLSEIFSVKKLNRALVTEIALQILIPLAMTLAAYAVLPASICPILLPIVVIAGVCAGMAVAKYLSARRENIEVISEIIQLKADRASSDSFRSSHAPQLFFERANTTPKAPLIELTPLVPRGIANPGGCCWMISLLQLLRCDKQFVAWVKSTPPNLSKKTITSPLYWAAFIPKHLLFSEAELADYLDPVRPWIPPLGVLNLEKWRSREDERLAKRLSKSDKEIIHNPDTPEEEKKKYLDYVKNKVGTWSLKIPELFTLSEGLFFSDLDVNIVIDKEYLKFFPGDLLEEKVRFAKGLIQELNNLKLAGEVKKQIQQLITDLRASQSLFRKFTAHPYAPYIPLEFIFGKEMPDKLPDSLTAHFEGKDRDKLKNEVLKHIEEVRKQLSAVPIPPETELETLLKTYQTVHNLNAKEKGELLNHLKPIYSIEPSKREPVIEVLTGLNQFFRKYDEAIEKGQRVVDVKAKDLGTSVLYLDHEVDSDSPVGGDPAEALTILEKLFPPEQRVQIQTKKLYKTFPNKEKQKEVIREESSFGFIAIDLDEGKVGVDECVQKFFNSNSKDEKINSDGVEYSVESTEIRFTKAPESLYLHLKRFDHEGKKLLTKVTLTDSLMVPIKDEADVKYQLDSFTEARGSSSESGHHISYRREGDEWYRIDDDRITKIKGDDLIEAKKNGYVCHYSKISSL